MFMAIAVGTSGAIDVFGWLMRGGWLVGWAGFYLMLLYFVLIFG